MFSIYVNLIELSLFPTFSNISSVFLPRKILSNIHRSSRPAVVQLECTWLQLIRNDKRRIQTCATHTHTHRVKLEFQLEFQFPTASDRDLIPNTLIVFRRPASRTSRTGSSTSGRWSRSGPFTWEEPSKSPFIFQRQLQPSTTRDEGKDRQSRLFQYSLLSWL